MKWILFEKEKPAKAGKYLVDTGEMGVFYEMMWEKVPGSGWKWLEWGFDHDLEEPAWIITSEKVFAWTEFTKRIVEIVKYQ